MQEFFDCLISTNGMAYVTGLIIFLITLFLTARHIIGFTLTLLFLIFALIAAFGVANKDLIRNYFEHLSQKSDTSKKGTYESADQSNSSQASISEQLQKAYDDLKAEIEIQKKKFQSFIEEQRASHEKPDQTRPSSPENQ